ncbi:Rap1a/Tai family immunity protein [Thalassotalea ganghwensis]
MKRCKHRTFKIAALAATLVFSQVSFADSVSATVIESCQTERQTASNSKTSACKVYIEGFLDALAIDWRNITRATPSVAHQNESTGFINRAYQTRVTERPSLPMANSPSHICLPESTSNSLVVETVIKAIKGGSLEKKSLNQTVLDILIEQFPCDKDKQSRLSSGNF